MSDDVPLERVPGLPRTVTAADRRRLLRIGLIGGRWDSPTWDRSIETRGGIVGAVVTLGIGGVITVMAGRGVFVDGEPLAWIGVAFGLLVLAVGMREVVYSVRAFRAHSRLR